MSSNIKGGGRAVISQESQKALIDLLWCLDESNSDDKKEPSKHDKKRLEKKFVKSLVQRHHKRQFQQKFNSSVSKPTKEKAERGDHLVGPQSTQNPSSQNVRVELVEAIFLTNEEKKKKKKKNKEDPKKKRKQKGSEFRVGCKKVVVMPRTTTISELLKQSKIKLKLKKKPLRVFLQTADSAVFDLEQDLAGIDDGSVLYVSATPSTKENESSSISSNDMEHQNISKDENFDPLDSVKSAYKQQELYRQQKQHERVDEIVDEHRREKHAQTRSKLPVAFRKQHILDTIGKNQVVVLSGATGSGKSTQVPQFLLDHQQQALQRPYIVVTQPRKVAAISLAQRVAAERGCPPPGSKGSSVGYMVRSDRRVDIRSCRIIYMTIGILLRMLVQPQSDKHPVDNDENLVPILSIKTISHLIIDEVHERDVSTDFTLTLLKSVIGAKSPQNSVPRLVLMSATASSDLFIKYFTTNGVSPMGVEVPGKTSPVKTNWLLDCEKFSGRTMITRNKESKLNESVNGNSSSSDDLSPRAIDKIDDKFVRSLIVKIIEQQQSEGLLQKTSNGQDRAAGAVLVFLPGLGEIESLSRCLREKETIVGDRSLCKIAKLHSSISKSEQGRAFQPALKGTMKIVLATNIAETSLTIPDISHVIDTCRVKETRYNPSTRIKELVTVWTSRASLKQRAGRAGRVSEGVCWRLCSEEFADQHLLAQTTPEIVRIPLDELILQICLLYEQRRDEFYHSSKGVGDGSVEHQFAVGVKPIKFLSMTPTPPPESSLVQACKHLLDVDALKVVDYGDSSEVRKGWFYRLTPLGYHLSRLPMDAKVGKLLIVGCILGCLGNALTIAAALSCTKRCFLPTGFGGRQTDLDCIDARDSLIADGFGGKDWIGGTVKGDLIAVIAVYRAWKKERNDKRERFSRNHALDNASLHEIDTLRSQFMDLIIDAGLVSKPASPASKGSDLLEMHDCNLASEDALLTSCCLVAGLYPNICTLMRPRKGSGQRGGRLLTNESDECRPSSNSFQRNRVKEVSYTGKDAYAVYHAKHRTIGTVTPGSPRRPPETFLTEVNFVSKFALLLFGGQLDLVKNAIIVDGWLKFKVSGDAEKGRGGDVDNAVLILAVRDLLDNLILEHVMETFSSSEEKCNMVERHNRIIEVVRKLLAEEG